MGCVPAAGQEKPECANCNQRLLQPASALQDDPTLPKRPDLRAWRSHCSGGTTDGHIHGAWPSSSVGCTEQLSRGASLVLSGRSHLALVIVVLRRPERDVPFSQSAS
jgi:hypothetical protein